MDTVRPRSALNHKQSKFARTFQKVINIRTATKVASNNGICLLTSQTRTKDDADDDLDIPNKHFDQDFKIRNRNRAIMEALIAKLFAGVTSIKAAYAELQMAQHPYNSEAIQVADQSVVSELKAISELKRSFLRKELDFSPQVTLMLAEIQEQQGLMKTYEITIKKLEGEVERKDFEVSSLNKRLEDSVSYNKSLDKRLNSSGSLSMFENLKLSVLNPTHFIQFLQVTLKSIRNFVKIMTHEMESASWDLDAAIQFIQPHASFTKQSHRCFAFESFVSITMFEGFNYPNFTAPNDTHLPQDRQIFFQKFKKLKSFSSKHLLMENPNSSFAKFTRSKYLQLVHAKMECSLFGNLNQRKLISSGGYPETPFFTAFVEMSKLVWLLHCLAFSFGEEVDTFQVKKDCRFSEVYMECVTHDSLLCSTELNGSNSNLEVRVTFTVVPGFKIGKTVIQSQVYLSPAITDPTCC